MPAIVKPTGHGVEPAPFIPTNRDMSTAARLRLIADILEEHPERHVQENWISDEVNNGYDNVYTLIGHDHNGYDINEEDLVVAIASAKSCGKAGCVAGWAAAASPPRLMESAVSDYLDDSNRTVWGSHKHDVWVLAGSKALGIDRDLGDVLFAAENKRSRLIKALRVLAELDPRDRTLYNAELLGIATNSHWLEGEGRARLACDGKDVTEWLNGKIARENALNAGRDKR